MYLFVRPFLVSQKKNPSNVGTREKKANFLTDQIFLCYKNCKSSQRILLAFGILLFVRLYEVYKTVRSSVIYRLPRPRSDCAMIRPQQHGLAVLVSSTPILSLQVFIIAIFFGLEVYMSRNCPK